jgi:hypothetical protein
MGVKIQNGAPISQSYTFSRAGAIHMIEENGSGWLRWLLKQGDVIQAYSNHREKRYDLELPFARHIYYYLLGPPLIQGALALVNISKKEMWILKALGCRQPYS